MTTLINKVAVNNWSCQWHFGNDPNLSVSKLELKQITLLLASTNPCSIAKRQSSISMEFFVQFLSSSPNDPATSNGGGGGVATFWCEQCAMTTFVRLLKTRSAFPIVKDCQLWAIRAWIAHCARPLKAVAPFITSAIGLGPKLMRMLAIKMMLMSCFQFLGYIDLPKQKLLTKLIDQHK